MAWKCFMVEYLDAPSFYFRHDGKVVSFNDLPVGAMYFEDGELVVKLPSGSEWNIDQGRNYNSQPDRAGKTRLPQWTRIGEPPMVTASPSINHVGQYHGWLRNGVLTDDCEGRVFPGVA
jgi:hypothetical protein